MSLRQKTGRSPLSATALMEGREVKAEERSVRLLKSSPPERGLTALSMNIPDPEAYTQGLEFDEKIYMKAPTKRQIFPAKSGL